MSKPVTNILTLALIFFTTACTKSKTGFIQKNHFDHITLKLEKKLDIQLEPNSSSDTEIKLNANIRYTRPIQSLNAKWSVVSLSDEILSQTEQKVIPNKSLFTFESDFLKIPDSESEYKIVLEINAQSGQEQIVKSEIYYTKSQTEINEAIENLQERSSTPDKL
jgi:hypothetical protein